MADASLTPSLPSPRLTLITLATSGLDSPHSKINYAVQLNRFFDWLESSHLQFNRSTVLAYKDHLTKAGKSASTVNVALSAVRRLAKEAGYANMLPANTVDGVVDVAGVKSLGRRAGNWLTREEAQTLLETSTKTSDATTLRDRVILALLMGCGLRRSEACNVRWEDVQQRDGRWVIVDLKGKGNRVRTAPVPSFAKGTMDRLAEITRVKEGFVLRPMYKNGRMAGSKMSESAVFRRVKALSKLMGKEIAPHDLRRTYAKLAHKGNSPIDQISLSLGHSSIKTTEIYLGVEQDLTDAPCDHLGLKG